MPEISLGKFNFSIILLLFLASCQNDSKNQDENNVGSTNTNQQVDQQNNTVIAEYGIANQVAQATQREMAEQTRLKATADFVEGTTAVAQRRPAEFQRK